MRKTYTGFVTKLKSNQVFVFGSNPCGVQGAGAALVASKNNWCRRNELMDNRLSDVGKSYGLVTVNGPGQPLSLTAAEICSNIDRLYHFAKRNSELEFLIGYTGEDPNFVSLNGYRTIDMASFFMLCGDIPWNIVFQDKFAEIMFSISKSIEPYFPK